MTTQEEASYKQELVELIYQFLAQQIASENLCEAAKESLTVAVECIEQSYKVQNKNPSNELLDIYKKSKEQSTSGSQSSSAGSIPVDLLRNLASNILSHASSPSANAESASNPQPATEQTTSSSSGQNSNSTQSNPPRVRKQVTKAERLSAESFKNQGNDLMKEEKYQEAYDSYTKAIDIDDNNAIYYSNRAAASSKLGNHQAALEDCLEAIEIDPTYSKAHGRLGLAYASMNNHQKAKEAYTKAVELDPTNEGYKNNLKIAEESLQAGGNLGPNLGNIADQLASSFAGGQGNMSNMLRSMMGNPELVQMAMRSLQDPRMQNLFGNLAGGGAAGPRPPQ